MELSSGLSKMCSGTWVCNPVLKKRLSRYSECGILTECWWPMEGPGKVGTPVVLSIGRLKPGDSAQEAEAGRALHPTIEASLV